MTSRNTVAAIAGIDRGVADAAFGRPEAIVMGGWPGAATGRAWACCAEFLRDAAAGMIPGDVGVLMYDPERWDATPIEEQRDPIPFARRFVEAARALGRRTLVTPHPNLMEAPGARCGPRPGESREAAYLRCGIAGATAALADIYLVQGQYLENDPVAFEDLVAGAAAQAREANPRVTVLATLATHPGFAATPEMLDAAYRPVEHLVDGCYLALSKRRLPRVLAGFLRLALERST